MVISLSLPLSLGAFVFRVVHHLGGLTDSSLREDVVAEMDWGMPWKQENEAHEAGPRTARESVKKRENPMKNDEKPLKIH